MRGGPSPGGCCRDFFSAATDGVAGGVIELACVALTKSVGAPSGICGKAPDLVHGRESQTAAGICASHICNKIPSAAGLIVWPSTPCKTLNLTPLGSGAAQIVATSPPWGLVLIIAVSVVLTAGLCCLAKHRCRKHAPDEMKARLFAQHVQGVQRQPAVR